MIVSHLGGPSEPGVVVLNCHLSSWEAEDYEFIVTRVETAVLAPTAPQSEDSGLPLERTLPYTL